MVKVIQALALQDSLLIRLLVNFLIDTVDRSKPQTTFPNSLEMIFPELKMLIWKSICAADSDWRGIWRVTLQCLSRRVGLGTDQ
jgi:hypothetical protein